MNRSVCILCTVFLCVTLSALQTAKGQQKDSLDAEDILQMSLYDLMNIQVISASKTDQSVKDVPASVHVITSDQIRDRAYFTLEEALSDLPGFQFRNTVGFNSYVFMRGATSQNNLIILMIDGIPINEVNSGGFYAGGQFNMSDIEQIEVVYGPASALYGTNAVSGIINIISRKPDGNSGHVSILGGNFKTGLVNFDLERYDNVKDIGYSLSGQYKTTEKADLRGAKGDYNWTDEMENFENDLSLSANLRIRNFSSGVIFQEKKSSKTTNFRSVGDTSLDRNTLWDIYFLNAYIRYSINSHEKWNFVSKAYYRNSTVKPNTIDQIVKAGPESPGYQIGYYRPNHLLGIENQLTYSPGEKWLLSGGIIGEMENLSNGFSITYSDSQDTRPDTPSRPPDLHNYLVSYFFQGRYSVLKPLSLSAGVRHDFSSYYGNVFVPRAGLVYSMNNISVKALYNQAFRAPKPWDYNDGEGNPDLRPEKMRSLELDLSYRLQENIILGGAVFNNKIEDKLTRELTEESYRWINNDMLTTTGFELYGNYNKGNLSVYTNYSFNDSRNQDDIIIPEISKHTVNAGFTVSLPENFRLNLRANYLGERTNPFTITSTGSDKLDDAIIFNGCLTFAGIRKLNLQLKVNNILNAEYYHPSNRFAGRYRQPQRTVMMMATYDFDLKGSND